MQCVYGKKIFTGKAVIENAYLIFNQQQIIALAKTPQGERLGEFPVITPAFIDPHSHIGMIRAGEPAGEAEGNEHLDSILSLSERKKKLFFQPRSRFCASFFWGKSSYGCTCTRSTISPLYCA